jgi:hypothetical protein
MSGMDTRIGEDFFESFTVPQCKDIADFFNDLGLPVPLKHEFYEACNGGRNIVFLSDYGLTLQIARLDRLPSFNNKHFLQPLYQRIKGQLKMWLSPGIDSPVENDEAESFRSYMRFKQGVFIQDCNFTNVGFIPKTQPRFPVLLDLDSANVILTSDMLQRLTQSVHSVRKFLPPVLGGDAWGLEDVQQDVYGELRRAAVRAFDEEKGDMVLRSLFFMACQDGKSDGLLMSPWDSFNYRGSRDAAENYSKRITLLPRF